MLHLYKGEICRTPFSFMSVSVLNIGPIHDLTYKSILFYYSFPQYIQNVPKRNILIIIWNINLALDLRMLR